MTDVVASGLPTRTVFVSPPHRPELGAARRPPTRTSRSVPRIGTDLWLGDRGALPVTATVLDVHPVERGDTFGYRGRRAREPGTIVVVSGGTAHGIGLEAPTGEQSLKARAAPIARGGLDAAGFVRSPYTVDGKQRLFAEPPHMQASMLFVPSGVSGARGRRRDRRPGPLHRDRLRPRRHHLRHRTTSCSGRSTSRTTTTTR